MKNLSVEGIRVGYDDYQAILAFNFGYGCQLFSIEVGEIRRSATIREG